MSHKVLKLVGKVHQFFVDWKKLTCLAAVLNEEKISKNILDNAFKFILNRFCDSGLCHKNVRKTLLFGEVRVKKIENFTLI